MNAVEIIGVLVAGALCVCFLVVFVAATVVAVGRMKKRDDDGRRR